MYLTPTLWACLLLGQTAGDGSPRAAPIPALPEMAPPTVLPEPKKTFSYRDSTDSSAGGRGQPPAGVPALMPDLPGTPGQVPGLPGTAGQVPGLPGTPPPRTDVAPASPYSIPKSPGEPADRTANPPAARDAHRPTSAQVVADLSRLPEGAAVVGSPLSLVQAVSHASDRSKQAAVIHAYWRLTQAVAEYHICFEADQQLGQVRAREEAGTVLLTAQAEAKAALQAARVAVSTAQYDLAAAAQLSPATALPLAANLPHAGAYRTSFEQIASRPSTPSAARLLNRTLNDNYQAIQQRLTALHEADTALAAATELYQAGLGDLQGLLRCHDALVSQQRIFMADVCDYNHRIVDYVLSVLDRPMASQALVDMLIFTEHSIRAPAGAPAQPGRSLTPSAAPDQRRAGVTPGKSGLDVDPNAVRAASSEEPVSKPTVPPRGGMRSILQHRRDDRTVAEAPAEHKTDAGVAPSLLTSPTAPLVPVPPPAESSSLPGPRTAQMQVSRPADPKNQELFSSLVEKSVASRAQELSAELNASSPASDASVKAVELRDCLRLARPADRREVIAAYWLARQRAAEHQWLLVEKAWFDQLDQPARDHRAASAAGPLETVRVRAVREAVNADLFESGIALTEAEFDLTRHCGAPAGSPWFLPITPPHAGPYDLKKGSLPPQMAQSWAVRRLLEVVPGYLDDLQHRAHATVQADVARAAFTTTYQEGNVPVETVLSQIEKETAEVRAFLQAGTKYNQSIAEYVLLVAPPTIDAETLSRALVIPRAQAPASKPL